jgi:hypothetical protein
MLDPNDPRRRVEVEVYLVAGGKLFERDALDEIVHVWILGAAAGALHGTEASGNAVAGKLHVKGTVEAIEALGRALGDLEASVERRFS